MQSGNWNSFQEGNKKELLIIIPAYNEALNIVRVVDEMPQEMQTVYDDYEILQYYNMMGN